MENIEPLRNDSELRDFSVKPINLNFKSLSDLFLSPKVLATKYRISSQVMCGFCRYIGFALAC